MTKTFVFAIVTIVFLAFCGTLQAQNPRAAIQAPPDVKPMSPTLEDVSYPHPVKYMPLTLYTSRTAL